MTEGKSGTQAPENSASITPKETPMEKDQKTQDKKTGTDWLGLAYIIIGIFVLIAAFQLYFTIQGLISTWISDQFVPVVSALYYLAIIIVGVWLLRDYIRKQ